MRVTEPPQNADGQERRWRVAFGPPWFAGIASALLLAVVVAGATAILRGDTDPSDLVRVTSPIEWQAGNHWIVPSQASDGDGPPPAPSYTETQQNQRIRWFAEHRGVPANSYWIRVEIVNDSAATLTIRPSRSKPFNGSPHCAAIHW